MKCSGVCDPHIVPRTPWTLLLPQSLGETHDTLGATMARSHSHQPTKKAAGAPATSQSVGATGVSQRPTNLGIYILTATGKHRSRGRPPSAQQTGQTPLTSCWESRGHRSKLSTQWKPQHQAKHAVKTAVAEPKRPVGAAYLAPYKHHSPKRGARQEPQPQAQHLAGALAVTCSLLQPGLLQHTQAPSRTQGHKPST